MIYRCIAADWAVNESNPPLKKVIEGEFSFERLEELNATGYNIYCCPNFEDSIELTKPLDGSMVHTFKWVFVDMDLKENVYSSKEEFISVLATFKLSPTKIVDSGNGIHAYWRVSDLDAMSYLRFQRRLTRLFKTDEAVGKIFQLMRVPNTVNTKRLESLHLCRVIQNEDQRIYTAEELDRQLPPISQADEAYCQNHYNQTYNSSAILSEISDKLPPKFAALLRQNPEVKELWSNPQDDRSKSDYRLGHLLFANSFSREEAASVLVNTAKAINRAPHHRLNYAQNIIDKIWTYELSDPELTLSNSIKDILSKNPSALKGIPFRCHKWLDNTQHGFRLGHVIGLVAGSGVGKTTVALNMFRWFVERNPDYVHFFIPLEQPANEIAARWQTLCGDDTQLHEKVHVMSNYDENGAFRHLSFDEIKDYLLKFQEVTKKKIGTVVIDHIGALKKQSKNGENQALMDIMHQMKGFAIETNTLLIMQSQAPREKAGIGDVELNKDSAYGSVFFESYCDFLLTIWQPLKRMYASGAPTILSFKFAKIRHKNQKQDDIQEDVVYNLYYDTLTERLGELTEKQEQQFEYYAKQAMKRREDTRKGDVSHYVSRRVDEA
jgi:hypothetical protein